MSIEVKRTPIFSNPDLEAEHSALHTMACIIAQKWMPLPEPWKGADDE